MPYRVWAPGTGKPRLFETYIAGSSRNSVIASVLPWLLVVLLAACLLFERLTSPTRSKNGPPLLDTTSLESAESRQLKMGKKIFVSYSYFEKDVIQV
jgi:hypothetical protein